MKKLRLVAILIFLYQLGSAQEFQFPMFFEDAVGNMDTLTIGYDINGTKLIDSAFGESNIIEIPLDSIFDVRISDAFINNGVASFHTKKQILPDSCSGWRFPVVSIDIKCKNWPVTATWDNSLFNTECREGSVFTSFRPGGWWDVVGFSSDLSKVELANEYQVTFTSNYKPSSAYKGNYSYINSSNDTIPVFWMAFGDSTIITLDVESMSLEFNLYPNPVKDFLYIDIQNDFINDIRLIDMLGRSKLVEFKDGFIDMSGFHSGYYLIIINRKDGNTISSKIIKQ
ncbi:T9SS type A sorting domain-containing protein [Draconibacterium sp. IB214405]|uniref:T9SS type A sorting domain-containing protein n=1 Tax=Draconibacterium sp. IB214405 TaxID=3097352 RepID=UPI002A126CFF|nr:T9SS type A sorting domain-containing protein [Draconibacterium sp. IB214405]MDX8340434.1 T9SS type A sorting domain-containing protein [Draconibacterium sp. IB214405]